MKLLVGLNNKKIEDYLNYTNSFIIGIKDFSINYVEYNLNEIKELLSKYPNIELFVSMNKNVFNNDLEELEKILIELDKLKIKGVLFYDMALVSLKEKLGLKLDLVWNQDHLVTNYNTCNYYYSKGVNYAYISSDITVDEIKEINDKCPISLISLVLGYPIVSFSKRKLLSNYFTYCNSEKKEDVYKINSNDSPNYLIKENSLGTSIRYGNILNGVKPLYDLQNTINYALLDEEMIEHSVFLEVLSLFKELIDNNYDNYLEIERKVSELINSDDTCFYYKKTIYKVRDEK